MRAGHLKRVPQPVTIKACCALEPPLPEGLGAVIEKSPEGKDVRFYGVMSLPLPMGGFPWFEAMEYA